MRQLLARLRREERGATIIEFAVVVPVLMIVMMGLLDMTYRLYATAMLNGELQKAARDATLQNSASVTAQTALDQRVINSFREINGTVTAANFTFTRRNYADFTSAGKMEPTTGPGGVCAPTFTYVDVNNNSTWDDGATSGQGGAKDVVLYTVQVTYTSLFPVNALFGASSQQTVRASTVLRNQPYGAQATRAPGPTRNC